MLSLHEAAQLLANERVSVHDAEVFLAQAIERGELLADIRRRVTEQWDCKDLPGNISARRTVIEWADLERWQKEKGALEDSGRGGGEKEEALPG